MVSSSAPPGTVAAKVPAPAPVSEARRLHSEGVSPAEGAERPPAGSTPTSSAVPATGGCDGCPLQLGRPDADGAAHAGAGAGGRRRARPTASAGRR